MPVVGECICGVGLSSLIVVYQAFVSAATEAGYEITLEMQGLISGTFNAFISVG